MSHVRMRYWLSLCWKRSLSATADSCIVSVLHLFPCQFSTEATPAATSKCLPHCAPVNVPHPYEALAFTLQNHLHLAIMDKIVPPKSPSKKEANSGFERVPDAGKICCATTPTLSLLTCVIIVVAKSFITVLGFAAAVALVVVVVTADSFFTCFVIFWSHYALPQHTIWCSHPNLYLMEKFHHVMD